MRRKDLKTRACSNREKGASKLAAAATPLDQKGRQDGADDTACSLVGVRRVGSVDRSVSALGALCNQSLVGSLPEKADWTAHL